MTDKKLVVVLRKARDALSLAKQIKCTCSGFVLQYEGGCQCKAGRAVYTAREYLDNLIKKL